jgi:hypothetical protein
MEITKGAFFLAEINIGSKFGDCIVKYKNILRISRLRSAGQLELFSLPPGTQ